jgi:hypothetical protein
LICEPFFHNDEVIFFVVRGLDSPRRITVKKPFHGPDVKISVYHLSMASIPAGKEKI